MDSYTPKRILRQIRRYGHYSVLANISDEFNRQVQLASEFKKTFKVVTVQDKSMIPSQALVYIRTGGHPDPEIAALPFNPMIDYSDTYIPVQYHYLIRKEATNAA